MQPGLHPSHVMNPRVLKRLLEDRVKQLILTKIKFLSLKKLNFCTFENIENQTKELWLVNGCTIFFRRKLEDTEWQIVSSLGMVSQYFFTVLSAWNREELFRRCECESTINFKTTLSVFRTVVSNINRTVMLYLVLNFKLYFK